MSQGEEKQEVLAPAGEEKDVQAEAKTEAEAGVAPQKGGEKRPAPEGEGEGEKDLKRAKVQACVVTTPDVRSRGARMKEVSVGGEKIFLLFGTCIAGRLTFSDEGWKVEGSTVTYETLDEALEDGVEDKASVVLALKDASVSTREIHRETGLVLFRPPEGVSVCAARLQRDSLLLQFPKGFGIHGTFCLDCGKQNRATTLVPPNGAGGYVLTDPCKCRDRKVCPKCGKQNRATTLVPPNGAGGYVLTDPCKCRDRKVDLRVVVLGDEHLQVEVRDQDGGKSLLANEVCVVETLAQVAEDSVGEAWCPDEDKRNAYFKNMEKVFLSRGNSSA
jgi:hypothetical protein